MATFQNLYLLDFDSLAFFVLAKISVHISFVFERKMMSFLLLKLYNSIPCLVSLSDFCARFYLISISQISITSKPSNPSYICSSFCNSTYYNTVCALLFCCKKPAETIGNPDFPCPDHALKIKIKMAKPSVSPHL